MTSDQHSSANSTRPAGGCPECGARVKPTDLKCWLCGRALVVSAEVVEEFAGSPFAQQSPFAPGWSPRADVPAKPYQFSLESMLMVITLVAVCLGAFVATPGLGILALIVAAPALARTLYEGHQARKAGKSLTTVEKILAFSASAGIALAALVAAVGALFVACTASVLALCLAESTNRGQYNAFSQNIVWVFVVICGLSALGAFVGMFWLTWPSRRVR